jgi:hypothetical protein
MLIFGVVLQAATLRQSVEEEIILRAARTLPADSLVHITVAFMLSAHLTDLLNEWLCQKALYALVRIFKECSDFGELLQQWNEWLNQNENVLSWGKLFGNPMPVDVKASLKVSSCVYYWCLDAVFAAFKRCVKYDAHQSAVVLVKSNSMLEVDTNIDRMQPRIRECAVRLTGALFHKMSVFYYKLGDDELCMLIDKLTVSLAELNACDQSIFLRAYDKGFLQYPTNEMILFAIEVRCLCCCSCVYVLCDSFCRLRDFIHFSAHHYFLRALSPFSGFAIRCCTDESETVGRACQSRYPRNFRQRAQQSNNQDGLVARCCRPADP